MKTKTKQVFKTAITIPILLMMMLLSFSVHAQTHVYNEGTSSGIFPDPDGALVANPLSDAFNSSANCARAATGGFGKLQIFPTYTPGAADRLYFSVYNPGNASFAQVKFEYTGAPGVWEDGGDVYYGSASTSGWVEYSIGLAPNEGNTINKIILMPSGSSSVAVYADNIYFHTTSLYPTSGATHFFKDVVENGLLFHSGAGIFSNPLPADPINSSASCIRTNGTGAWRETQVFNARYVVKTADKLFISFYNPNNATQWQLRFLFRDGDYLGPADTAHVTAAASGWNEISVDLSSYIGKEIEKIVLFAAHSESIQVYSDNIYIGSASVIPQQPIVYNETISSGMWFQGTNGAQVANPVSDVVNPSANVARSATDGSWQQIQYFPNYTVAAGNKLYFSVHNPNGATFGQVQFEYTTGGGWQSGGDVTYVSGSTTGWREYSINLTGHVGNTINKIILMPAGDSSAAVYVDNIFFASTSSTPSPQTPIVYNETISSGMFFQGTNGAQVSNPVSDAVNSSANVARSATDGAWQQIQYFPNYTVVAGNKLYFSVHNPNGATFAQVQFEYTTGGGWQYGGDVTYVSGSTTGWREYSIDLTGHVGNTINKIILMPAGDSSAAVYVDNIFFASTSSTPSPQTPTVYNETISSGMWFQGTNGAQVANPVSDAVNSSANVARSATDGSWQQIQYFPNYTVATGNKLYFSVHNPNGATFGQVQFEYTTGGGWQYGGDVTYVSGSTTGWREYSIDLTGHVGNTINKIILMPAGDSSAAVYVDNIYFGSTSILPPAPQQPIVYNEVITSGMFIDGDGSPVANPVKDLVNFSANCAKSGTGGWQKIEYFPTYTPASGSKLYFSVYNPNNAGPGQLQFEYTSGGGWQWGGNLTYVSGSLTGWVEYSVDLTAHVGNTINKIIVFPAGGSSTAAYIDNVYFGTTSVIPQASTFCKGAATVTIAKGTTDLQLYTSPTSAALAGTTALTSKVYYATLNGSARTAVTVTVNPLPSTPASMATTDAVLCKHIGTTNEVTYSVPVPDLPAVAVASYSWSLPEGVNPIGATNTNTITVNFAGSALNNTSVGGIGTISARAISALGCSSAPRSLILTSKLPTSPTSLVLTSTDNTPHFNAITTPAVVGVSPAITSVVGLNFLSKITKVGPYMGTNTVFTLTALTGLTPAPTAASYAWTLPGGVTQLSGGTSNVITVDFAGVTPGIGLLPISVKSVGGCGPAAVARTLNLSRALPTAPTALVVTDDAISTTTAITKVSAYTGKTTPLTLTATPVRVQGATATSYAWRLPAGVNIVSPTATATTIYLLENQGTVEVPNMVNVAYDAWSTGTVSTITVNFAGVAEGTLSFPLTVYAVNGAGNSKARTRTVTAAAPATPSIVGSGGTGTSGQFSSCLTKTYTATSTSTGITSYTWTIPADAQIVGAANGNVIVVNYSATSVAVGASSAVTCYATNGTGNSLTKSLTVKRMPATCRLANASDDFKVSAYPNPSSSEFTIETSAKGAMSVKVYDMQGRLVEKAYTNRVGSKLATGTYNVIVNQGANTKSVRVIKN